MKEEILVAFFFCCTFASHSGSVDDSSATDAVSTATVPWQTIESALPE